jgi:Uma2 family endonuclease
MTSPPTPDLMTAEELLHLPEDGCRYELSRGKLIRWDLAAYWSSMVGAAIGVWIGDFVDRRRLGIVSACGGMLLARDPDTVRAPRISVVRKERVPPNIGRGFFPGPPDLAVDVLSASDRFVEVNRRIRDYFAAGTPLVWVIDPESRSALVYHPDRPVKIVAPDGALDGEGILPGFSLSLPALWAELDLQV